MIKGIALDLEGTVVNVEWAHHEGMIRAAKEIGVELTFESALLKIPNFIGGPDEKNTEQIYALSDKSKPINFLRERKKFWYHELLRMMRIECREGFRVVLQEFKRLGLCVSIGSLTTTSQAKHLLAKSGLDRMIDPSHIVLKEDVKNLKPAPDVFVETAKRMGVDPSSQLVFEDSPRGVAAALAAGSMAIGMPVYNLPKVVSPLVDMGAKRVFMHWGEINIPVLLDNLAKEARF